MPPLHCYINATESTADRFARICRIAMNIRICRAVPLAGTVQAVAVSVCRAAANIVGINAHAHGEEAVKAGIIRKSSSRIRVSTTRDE